MKPIVFDERTILDAGLDIVRAEGYEAVSMRRVAEAAGGSVQPLYSRFGDREKFMRALYDHAIGWVREYNEQHADAGCNVFSSVGVAHIRIAQHYPGIFSFVYMSPYVQADNMARLLSLAEQPGVLSSMCEMWGLSEDQARSLYANLAIYTHGLSTLIMAGAKFSDDELKAGMNDVFYALAKSVGAPIQRSGDES